MTHQYDRTGERIEVDEDDAAMRLHPTTCDRGWIEVDGTPATVAPCPSCRPEAVQRLRERTTTNRAKTQRREAS